MLATVPLEPVPPVLVGLLLHQPSLGPEPSSAPLLAMPVQPADSPVSTGRLVPPAPPSPPVLPAVTRTPGAPPRPQTATDAPAHRATGTVAGAGPGRGALGVVQRAVSRLTGTDLSGVTVRRARSSSEAARALGAMAFAAEGVVHVPNEVGTVSSGPGLALLAHELTHVAQQRRLGSSLPGEGTPAGRRLEEEARAVQRAVAGPVAPELALPHLVTTRSLAAPRISTPGIAGPQTSPHPGAPPLALPTGLARLVASGRARQRPDGTIVSAQRQAAASQVSAASTPAPPSREMAGAQRYSPSSEPAAPAASGSPGSATDEDVVELAERLYPHISQRLAAELRNDRERAGLISDVYRLGGF